MNIYLAHTPTDQRTASKLALDLMRRGLEVWIEQPNIEAEPLAPDARLAELHRAIDVADVFLLLLSPGGMVSPDLLAQIEYAASISRRIVRAERTEVALTKAFAVHLEGTDRVSVGRTTYDEGVRALLSLLGVNPDEIVNPIVSGLEVEEWLPGHWDALFYNPRTRVSGQAAYDFGSDKSAESEILLEDGADFWIRMHVAGSWTWSNDRLSVQGTSKMAMHIQESPLPKAMIYVMTLEIVELQEGRFHAVSQAGDRVIFIKRNP